MILTSTVHRLNQAICDEIALARSPLSKTQIMVMLAISANPKTPQRDIVMSTGVDRSTLADVVRRLITAGYLSRRRSPDDRRRDELSVTDAGAAVLASAKRCVKAAEKSALAKHRELRSLIAEAAE